MVTWPLATKSGSDAASTHIPIHNEAVDALNELNTRLPGTYASYTPTLTAATTSPTLGTGGIAQGYYTQFGKFVHAYFWIRFGTASRASGSGIYLVALPTAAKGRAYAAGMTSDHLGASNMWRAGGGLDLGGGAHVPIQYHTDQGDNTKALMTISAGSTAGNSVLATIAADQTGISTTTAVTGMSVTVPIWRNGARVKIHGSLAVGINTAANKTVYVDIMKDASLFQRISVEPSEVLSGFFGIQTVPILGIDDNPTQGSHTYSIQVTPEANTVDVKASSTQKGILLAETTALEPSGTDYVADNNPWDWASQTSQAEIWGNIVYEAA